MDSNFINIDELVRQRLSGGEEPIRAGAWDRMEGLLEEKKRRPFGLLFWRRGFTAAGVLMLLALLTIGGYKAVDYYRGAGDANGISAGFGGGSSASSHLVASNTADNTVGIEQPIEPAGQATLANRAVGTGNVANSPTGTSANAAKGAVASSARATHTNANQAIGQDRTSTSTAHINYRTTASYQSDKLPNHNTLSSNNRAASNLDVTASIGNQTKASNHPVTGTANPVPATASVNNSNNGTTVSQKGRSLARTQTSKTAGHPSAIAAINHPGKLKNSNTAQPVKNSAAVNMRQMPLAASSKATSNSKGLTALKNKTSSDAEVVENGASVAATPGKKMTTTNKVVAGNGLANNGAHSTQRRLKVKPLHNNRENQPVAVNKASVKTGVQGGSPKHATTGNAAIASISNPIDGSVADDVEETAMDGATTAVTTGQKAPKRAHATHPIKHGQHAPVASASSTASATAAISKPAQIATSTTLSPTANPVSTQVVASSAPATTKTSKQLEKIKIHQTTTGTFPGRSKVSLDTISIDQETVESESTEPSGASSTGKAKENEYASSTASNSVKTAATNVANTASGSANNKTGTNQRSTKTGSSTGTSTTITTGNSAGQAATTGNAGGVAAKTAATGTAAASTSGTATTASAKPAEKTSKLGKVDSNVLASATPPPAGPPPPPGPPTKKKSNHFLESLQDKFNDMKYNFSHVQVAPGMTAGINGTFFGPNSFKGFQFGVTAAFEIDKRWSFFTELKYFHRVNSDYSMHTTYDRYTQVSSVPGSGYFKDSIDRSFSFSTLHSFELPFSVKYAIGKLSVFLGGNFSYIFGINTGAADQLTGSSLTQARQIVSTVGSYSQPNLNSPDFGSRFAMGYLFGCSYKVAPNVVLDLRNAQNFWDNAKSASAKMVSTQLYKSPSIQFSVQYRFGARKEKD